MVSSIGSDSDSIQQMMAAMLQQMNKADTDGVRGLSKSELASIGSTGDVGGSAFLKSLSDQFDSLDADGNGQLSSEEIASAKPLDGPMGPPPGLDLGADVDSDSFDASLKATKNDSGSTPSTDSTGTSNSNDSILEKLLAKVLDNFTESYSKDDSEDKKEAVKALKEADTDGNGVLSKDELTSLANSSSATSELAKNLSDNFGSLDKNGDGSLSKDEIEKFISGSKMSQQEMAEITKNPDSSSNFSRILSNLSETFFQNLMSSYKSGDLANLTSSLGVAV